MEQINGPFKDIIPNFQKYKKSLGYKYDSINNYIRLDKILKNNNIHDLSDTKKIFDILITNEENIKKKKRHYYALSQLYQFMNLIGYKNLYFEQYYFSDSSKFEPTILTSSQVKTFFKALDNYCKKIPKPECDIFPVLFRLVYSNGLRISEAQNLKVIQYSLEKQSIYIEESKENVSRELPLSKSMIEIFNQYERLININQQTYLFELNSKKITTYKIDKIFDEVLELLDFKFRKHDLRHTMAVTTFNNLFDKGYKEYWILYYLHIFLGHRTFESTEYYLRYTDSRYKKMLKQVSEVYPNVFPKVGDDHE